MRLIDADALKASIEEKDRYNLGGEGRIVVCGMLDDTPTVDAEPVKHAYWIDLSEEYTDCDENVEIVKRFKCSSCGNKETTKSDYCRRCGAKMDGGADNA